jgi:histidinol-phosphate/aromatic aminotransferase/cobyric acid decarboxylase-like protein
MRESPATESVPCYHGGAFFKAIGDGFDDLERRHAIINADVLDAWFPPAPGVLEALHGSLDWLARTSPPTNCEGLIRTIARTRRIPVECVLPGAGSSDLVFRAFRHWLTPTSRVLLLDPTYGEYVHVCEHVVGCHIERFPLEQTSRYRLDMEQLHARLQFGGYNLVVIVNPNNPTGQHVPREELEFVLRNVPLPTKVWLDEAYLEYVGADQSLESFAAQSSNIVVCISLSKVYALSGLRAAYLCGAAEVIEPLRRWTPPWVIGLPAQVAAVRALEASAYYQSRYDETRQLRRQLIKGLRRLDPDWDLLGSQANFVLCQLPPSGPSATTLIEQCRERGLYLRDVEGMGTRMGRYMIRIAVKDEETQKRMLELMEN